MDASTVKGRAIISLETVASVGYVDDIFFDVAHRRVVGFRVKKGAFRHPEVLLCESVVSVDGDALTIARSDALKPEDRCPEVAGCVAFSKIRGAMVITEGGDGLGTVADVDMDGAACTVRAYKLSGSLLKRIEHREPAIGAGEVLRLGEGGVMIVPDTVRTRLQA